MGTDEMTFNAPFEIPFVIGVSVMFAVIAYKYLRWFIRMPSSDRRKVWKGIFTRSSVGAVGETVRESLLHRRIFKVNPLLGYMHTSLAFGWFLLIAVGWIETVAYLGFVFVPLHGHVFFKYFSTGMDHTSTMSLVFSNLMDLLLLVVLSGVALAWFKRMRSRAMGMKRTTRHTVGDRIALSALWIVFPARLVAESFTAGIYNNGGFLTGSIGKGLLHLLGENTLYDLQPYVWLIYSLALGIFFTAMPFSRYMHIFTEVPLIFLRRWGVRSSEKEQSYDHFQVEACSRCGICIDPCQLQSMSRYNDVQSVYFLRDRRYHRLREQTAMNCLMCGRCEVRCPVGIELNTLRLNSRDKMRNTPNEKRYEYLKGCDPSSGEGNVGYFAGCMTLLTPRILLSMQRIFDAAGEQVWWADKDGGVCCGRPLKLSGETDSARRMMEFICHIYKEREHTFRLPIFKNCMQNFLMDIYDKTKALFLHRNASNTTRQEELLERFIALVFQHSSTCREVQFYADRLCITTRYLSSIIQNLTGHSPKEHIDTRCIQEIKMQLRTTNKSMQEIAFQLNFPDQSFFSRYFKKHTGMTPAQYRLLKESKVPDLE